MEKDHILSLRAFFSFSKTNIFDKRVRDRMFYQKLFIETRTFVERVSPTKCHMKTISKKKNVMSILRKGQKFKI